ncbi:ATP-binding cassette domain-containing protein [Escherichia coli]|uniref:ATP-binding cassette domain-containing protein n=1 Tax=Escherichia coli TaxID=562 RepID=UPI0023D9921F|nr:ATP-binding cassette domain-containing protein [Escherichia coli]WEN22299.1 ATP-binding cassette domain-containing protein [Escherichia coli]
MKDFSAQVLRGDKIALIGPNGCGTNHAAETDARSASSGQRAYSRWHKLEVAYFDQHRAELDPDKTVMDNLAEGKQEVMVTGKPRHVLGYLQDFLFHPKRAMTPVRALSGGERNRLLLARLFLKPSNLLILDERPTILMSKRWNCWKKLIDSYQGTYCWLATIVSLLITPLQNAGSSKAAVKLVVMSAVIMTPVVSKSSMWRSNSLR